ncbi:hypothetical protein Lal_00025719 [Lupinus albus]|nr:hypothetical protein Lal_00025719 [Lupinus albus]
MYLPLLRDLTRVHRYSWGSACLANFRGKTWYRLPFLAPIVDRLHTYPFASRNLNYREIPRGDLTGYGSRLDRMDVNDFKWLPYENYVNNLPHEVLQDKNIWSACTTLICFSIVG